MRAVDVFLSLSSVFFEHVAAKQKNKSKQPATFSNQTFVLFLSSLAFSVLAYQIFRVVVDLIRAVREVQMRFQKKKAAEERANQRRQEEARKSMTKSAHRT